MDKKTLTCVLAAMLLLSLCIGCNQEQEPQSARGTMAEQKNTVTEVLESGMASDAPEPVAQKTAAPTDTAPSPTEPPVQPVKVDVDLAAMSATMVYSEVFAMMENPQEYVGKTVRMHGMFACSEGYEYYFCVVQDATACCAQGIEFILAGNPPFPQSYPKIGEQITVVGVFEGYLEGTQTYYHLRDAVLE